MFIAADIQCLPENGVEGQVEDLATETMAQVVAVAEAELVYLSCMHGAGDRNAVGHAVGHVKAEAGPGAHVKSVSVTCSRK